MILLGGGAFFGDNNLLSQSNGLKFAHITREDGLKDVSQIMYLTKDSRGVVWIGTLNGLYHFDGMKIKHHSIDQQNIPIGIIQSNFYEDSESNVWFSSYDKIYCYIRKEGKFKNLLLTSSKGDTITQGYRVFHIEPLSKRLWIKAGMEIIILNTEDLTNYTHLPFETKGEFFSVLMDQEGRVKQIYASPWLKGFGFEVFRNENNNWKKYEFLASEEAHSISKRPKISQSLIINDSLSWLISDQGLILFNIGNITPPLVFSPKVDQLRFMNALFWDRKTLLLSTYEHGLWLFNTENNSFQKFAASSNPDQGDLLSERIVAIYLDHEQHLWVSHRGIGIDYSIPTKRPDLNPIKGLSKTPISGKFILEDLSNQIWVGTVRQGIFVFDQECRLLEHIRYDDTGLPAPGISSLQSLSIDKLGRIWCSSRKNIFVYDGNWKKLQIPELKDATIFSIAHRKDNSSLLITAQGLLSIRIQDTFLITEETPVFSSSPTLNYDQIFEDQIGRLFTPYNNDALLVYSNNFKTIEKVNNAKGFFYDFNSNGDTIWVGTSNGLMLIDGDLEAKYVFQEEWEVGSHGIYTLQIDNEGNWWIPHESGLAVFYPSLSKLIQVSYKAKLSNGAFSQHGYLKASSGKMWFCHSEGVSVFTPDSLDLYRHAPNIQIDQLLVNNIPYNGKAPINESAAITLSHFENTLSFDLTAVGSYQPELNRIRYRLANYSNDWSIMENGSTAQFNLISPGLYTLEVIASNVNGFESPMRVLDIRIKLPIYQRWWFILLIFIITISGTWFIMFIYQKRKETIQRLKYERMLALEKERLRIARDLHEDLGSGLSALTVWANFLRGKTINTPISKDLEELSHQSKNLSKKVREVVWAISYRNDYLDKLIGYLHNYATKLLSKANIDCQIKCPPEISKMKVTGQKRRGVFLGFKEALNNIIKHANASSVIIVIEVRDQEFFIRISDNGQGFELTESNSFQGNGMLNMQQRMEEMNGVYTIDSNSSGTTVTFTLPI